MEKEQNMLFLLEQALMPRNATVSKSTDTPDVIFRVQMGNCSSRLFVFVTHRQRLANKIKNGVVCRLCSLASAAVWADVTFKQLKDTNNTDMRRSTVKCLLITEQT